MSQTLARTLRAVARQRAERDYPHQIDSILATLPEWKGAAEIDKLRDALKIARQWMPQYPIDETAKAEVERVDAALGWLPIGHSMDGTR